jgi:hypothetical protein
MIRPLFRENMLVIFLFDERIINGLSSLFVIYFYRIIYIIFVFRSKCHIAVLNEIKSFLKQTHLKFSSYMV